MSDHPRFLLHRLLSPEFGFGHDVILRVFNGDGELEGDLKAHGIIMALGSTVLKEFLFSQSGELLTWKVVEARGATLKIAKWMLDFLYLKPDAECGWDDASAEEIFQLASLADQFQIIELQKKAEEMLSAFPMAKEDILEVASIAVNFETHFPTASKALLDKCTSLLVSTMHTAEDVARFAEQAAKDSYLAPLVVKLLAGMTTCKKFPLFGEQEMQDQKFEDITQADVTRVSKDRCGLKCSKFAPNSMRGVSIVGQKLKNIGLAEKREEDPGPDVCSDCKMVKSKCFSGQTVRCVTPGQVGCRVVTHGTYWNLKNQGMVATVVKVADVGTVTVRWDKDWGSVGGKERKAGALTTHQLCPSVPHSAGKPVFKYLCSS